MKNVQENFLCRINDKDFCPSAGMCLKFEQSWSWVGSVTEDYVELAWKLINEFSTNHEVILVDTTILRYNFDLILLFLEDENEEERPEEAPVRWVFL